jgi:hypothetical protein
VLWVPELRRSVLSVSEIEKKGYHILFRDGQCCLCPDDLASDQWWFLELGRETYIG